MRKYAIARFCLWVIGLVYRTRDESLGRLIIDEGRQYMCRPDEPV